MRKRSKRNDVKAKENQAAALRQRRWLLTITLGISAALLGGLVGLAADTRTMFMFMAIGFIFGAFGGWVGGSADIWPTNIDKQGHWTKGYWRNMPPEVERFENYIAPDDEED
ncbi:MAG: hypothetical protein DWQ07_21090 [Chloroflexi bacterium]|nr:MAG: hypothetical protein DWQ07_21090 [Chloroflexota bacterium]MBL1194579.1 hypothetical protein [Chloroflexota bacterium]NOH11868.1 hypothetical protein [Chloroflexota bacterium]